jgi:hypothetical protein
MLAKILLALCLVATTVIIHAAGLVLALNRLPAAAWPRPQFWPVIWLLVRVAWWLIAVHAVEISVWALFYWWQGCLPDAETSFYFSGTTYTTIGYGDVVLPHEWRLFGPVEGLIGILMCGLSTGFFFAAVSRIYAARIAGKRS